MIIYKLIDILYQDNGKGPYKESKVGEKYDRRRNRLYTIDKEAVPWNGVYLEAVDEQGNFEFGGVWTTPLVKEYDEDGYHWLETANSFYKFEVVKEVNEDTDKEE